MDNYTNIPEPLKNVMHRLIMENRKLKLEKEELQRKVREINKLEEIGRHLDESHEHLQFYQDVLNLAMSITLGEAGGVYLLDYENHRLQLSLTQGDIAPPVRLVLEGARRSIQLMMVKGRVIELTVTDPLLLEMQRWDSSIKSVIFFPLTLDNALNGIGFIMHQHKSSTLNHADRFRDTGDILTILSRQASLMDNLNRLRFESESKHVYFNTIAALTEAIDAKDVYTAGHSQRVAEISTYIAYELGLSEQEIDVVHYGALLHDIGKIGVPETILNKKGRLTDDEFFAVKKHPVIGTTILRRIDFLDDALNIVRFHHEHFDGSGYPEGLKGEDIPFMARIVCVADAWDAMTSNRSYRKALPFGEAIYELEKNVGNQFDPFIINALQRGSFAQLRTI